MINKVAIQGVKGSFHHIVSQQYFGNNILNIECLSFDEVINTLINEKCDLAIMAIENSIVGSILPNYTLIDNHDLCIIGEKYIDIQQNLMTLPGQKIEDIHEVYSHPMALLQCKSFFKMHPHIKLVEDKDTAEVAQRIRNKKLKNVGAIASKLASELFELDIIAPSIQTIKHNETRFIIVKKTNLKQDNNNVNKVSLKFELDHKRGSLAAILNVMSDCKLNLTKIQSLPKIDKPWVYAFFVDATFDVYEDYNKAKSLMQIMAKEFKVLGEYKNEKI